MAKPNAIHYGEYCWIGEYNAMSYWEQIFCDANVLYEAYRKSIKASKWKGLTQVYLLNYMTHIFRLQRQLEERSFKPAPTTKFIQSERGRLRLISSLATQDRIVRHVLCDEILLPEVRKRVIYDNGASLKGRGISFARKRFEVHLHKYYREHQTNEGYVLFFDFSKFYDNMWHETAKRQFMELYPGDDYLEWILDVIYRAFEIDVSYMDDEEYAACMDELFIMLDYVKIPGHLKTGEKFMPKCVGIGDQLSQINGIFYPNRIDTYIKYVRAMKYYGRYMDDGYIISDSKEELRCLLDDIRAICGELGIHVNEKKTRIVKLSGTFKYLQVKYTLTASGHVIKRINPKRVTAMRRKLKKLALKVDCGEIGYDDVEQMFRSWMGSFYKLMSRQQRQNLIHLFEDLFGKEIEISNRKMTFHDRGSREAIT